MHSVKEWISKRTFHHRDFPAERIARERQLSVSVCVPTLNVAQTIGPLVANIAALKRQGVIDQLLVIDTASEDGTQKLAAQAGAQVVQSSDLLKQFGDTLGKGDAMWRSLSALTGDVICYVDGDIDHPIDHWVCGLIGPLVCLQGIEFTKGFFRRPFRHSPELIYPEGGGRVTELMARPALNVFYPELAGFFQPLSGGMAASASLLREKLSFVTGYGIEIGHLIDTYRAVGLDAMAQVDLELFQNQHKQLAELVPMAHAILCTIAKRLKEEERLDAYASETLLLAQQGKLEAHPVSLPERPPFTQVASLQR